MASTAAPDPGGGELPRDAAGMSARARRRLAPDALAYLETGTGREATLRANRRAWDAVWLRPRVLRDVSAVDPSTTVLETPWAIPLAIAPVGYQRLFHPEGEVATALAAARRGVVLVVSTRCSAPLEQVAAAGGPHWFQVYVMRDRGLTLELVHEACRLGARALLLTVDTAVPGTKRRCPVPPVPSRMDLRRSPHAPDVTPATIAWLAERSPVPVGVKGILHPDDARLAVSAGARLVVVSNHGGRQLDGAVASAVALPAVVAAVAGAVPVVVDGGITHGVDVVRALAMGARGVLAGRPIIHGLAAAGTDGVGAVLDRFRSELVEAMRLAGATRVDEVGPDLLAPSPAQAAQVAPGGTR